MKQNLQLLAALAITALAPLQSLANPVEYKIPATQAEFEQQWEVIPGTVDGTWTWVDDDVPYAYTVPFATSASASTGKVGATLVYAQPIEMKAGEVYYLQANVCSADYNDDTRFYIVLGTDKQNLPYIAENSNAFYVYRSRNLSKPDFQYKPADGNSYSKVTVSETGTYYIGIRSWYAGSYADKQLQFEGFKITKDTNYPDKVTSTSATADPNGGMEVTLAWTWPTKDKNGGTLSGTLGANIYRHTTKTKSELYKPENLIGTVNGGVPGEKATYTDTGITQPGRYYYYVAPFNDEGENSDATASTMFEVKWVGEDEKALNPLNLVLSSEDDGMKVKLTWEARVEGYNGGALIPEHLSYTITRSKDGGEYVTIKEGYKGNIPYADYTGTGYPEETFIDENLDGPGKYAYRVYLVYKGTQSVSSTAKYGYPENIFAGGAYSVPFSNTFDTSSSTSLWTITPTTGKWSYNSSYNCLYLSGSSWSDYSTYLITPGLRLEAGKTYRISCSAWVSSTISETATPTAFIGIAVGREGTEAAMTNLFTTDVNVKTDNKLVPEVYFSPEVTGTYYIGFNGKLNKNSSYLYLDDVMIEEGVAGPAVITDLTCTPDAAGANNATLTFTIPDKNAAGVALEALRDVVVSRSDEAGEVTVIKTLTGEDAALGRAVSLVDEVPAPGLYSYTVVSNTEEAASKPAVTTPLWIGYDVPKTIYTSSFSVTQDAFGVPTIKINTPNGSLGLHGGYLDMENLKYNIYRIPTVNAGDAQLIASIPEREYVDTEILNADWDKYKYAYSILNGTMESNRAETYATYAGGKIDAQSYTPDFTNEKYVESFEGSGYIYENGITFKNKGTSYSNIAAYLPPFYVNEGDATSYKLNLTASRANADYEEAIEILLCSVAVPETEATETAANLRAVPTSDQITVVETIKVTNSADNPLAKEIFVDVPQTGKYRIGFRLASAENKGVTVHTLSLEGLKPEVSGPVFIFDFEEESDFANDFDVQDGNNDGTKWKWNKYSSGSKTYSYATCSYWQVDGYNDIMTTKNAYTLSKGHAYTLDFEAWAETTPETSTLAIGYYPKGKPEQITRLYSNSSLKYINKYVGETPEKFQTTFEVEEDGEYQFVFMVIASERSGGASIDNVILNDGGSPMTPRPATEVVAEGAADFSLKATLAITLPVKSVTGADIPADGISKVEILKGEEVAGTLTTDLTPGATVTWTDESAAEGVNTYSVLVYCGELASSAVEASVYVGPLTPTVPTAVNAAKAEEGKVKITWSAPEKSAEDQPLKPELITYNVKRTINGGEAVAVATGISETEYLDTPPASDDFMTIVYSVEAVYSGRTSAAVEANAVKLGTYTLPYEESFANAVLPDDWEITTSDTSTYSPKQWKIANKMTSSPSATSFDEDGGMLTYNSYSISRDYWSQAITPEINMSGSTSPVLEFQFHHSTNSSSNADRIVIEVSENGGEFVELPNSEIKRYDGSTGWKLHQLPLAAYKDSKIKISFKAISAYGADMAVDAIRIYNAKSYDLEAGALTATAGSVNSGADAEFTFTVKNAAFADVPGSDYTVKIYVNGELNETLEGKDIAATQSVDFTFTAPTHGGHIEGGISAYAEVVFDKDEDDTNNVSDEVSVSVLAYNGQGVTGLTSTAENGTLRLTWDDITVEQFEKLESIITLDNEEDFITKADYDDDPTVASPAQFTGSNGHVWKNIDADGKTIPQQYSMKSTVRGFMFSSWDMTGNGSQKDYSGEREHGMLVATAPSKSDGAASDYLVSPKLPGKGKHILTFVAKSYTGAQTADFYVEYSTEETDFTVADVVAKFQPLGEKVHINDNYQEGGKWNEYSYMIPSNAKYVAIHNVGEVTGSTYYPINSVLCLDNIQIVSEPITKPTYNVYYSENAVKPDEGEEPLRLMAEEVAAAPKKHNTEAVASNEYVIALPSVNTAYYVSAVYPEGETALSAPHYYDIESGVEMVEADGNAMAVKVEGRTISIVNGNEFDLYTVNGLGVAFGVDSWTVAAPGVYVVKVGSKAVTVMVK